MPETEEPGAGPRPDSPEWRQDDQIPLSPTHAGDIAYAYLRLARPKQWIKNTLLFAGPIAGGKIFELHYFTLAAVAAVAYCFAASGLYMINDARDAKSDRHHPTKRYRPVAAGIISPRAATLAGSSLIAISLGIGLLITTHFIVALGTYVAITVAYSLWLKHQPVIDISIVALGFLLRAISGGLATNLPISVWFLTVAAFGSLFMVSGKRYAEAEVTGHLAGEHRAVLESYSAAFLNYVRSLSSAVAIAGYGLWAFEGFSLTSGYIFIQLSTVPFVVAILLYALQADLGNAGSPEDVILHNRPIQMVGALWAALIMLGLYFPQLAH